MVLKNKNIFTLQTFHIITTSAKPDPLDKLQRVNTEIIHTQLVPWFDACDQAFLCDGLQFLQSYKPP